VKDTIRKEAFKIISTRVQFRSLTIAQRSTILLEGLRDRSQVVASECSKMLSEYCSKQVGGDLVKVSNYFFPYNTFFFHFYGQFIEMLDPSKHIRACEVTCHEIVKKMEWKQLSEFIHSVLSMTCSCGNVCTCSGKQQITPSSALAMRVACQYVAEEKV